jgi:phosphatidylserine/phosphatidylglycerophosphate/cardiolipin synthase-like enzyme
MFRVRIVATGPELIREDVRSLEVVLQEIIDSARKEIQILAYAVTSSAMPVLQGLERAARRGVKVTLVLNNPEELEEGVRNFLSCLSREYPGHVKVLGFGGTDRALHAKAVVADRSVALVGSANLTGGGMIRNYEVGVVVEGEPASAIARVVDRVVLQASKPS